MARCPAVVLSPSARQRRLPSGRRAPGRSTPTPLASASPASPPRAPSDAPVRRRPRRRRRGGRWRPRAGHRLRVERWRLEVSRTARSDAQLQPVTPRAARSAASGLCAESGESSTSKVASSPLELEGFPAEVDLPVLDRLAERAAPRVVDPLGRVPSPSIAEARCSRRAEDARGPPRIARLAAATPWSPGGSLTASASHAGAEPMLGLPPREASRTARGCGPCSSRSRSDAAAHTCSNEGYSSSRRTLTETQRTITAATPGESPCTVPSPCGPCMACAVCPVCVR